MAKKLLILIFIFLGAFLLYSCGDSIEESTKTVSSISVEPGTASLEVGGTQTFTAYATYSDSSVSGVIASWTVSSTLGSVVQVGYSGLFTASAEGTGQVTATYSEVAGHAIVTITGASAEALATIEVSPAESNIRVSQSRSFTASGISASGESMAIDPTWTLTGESVGTFSFSGRDATLEANAEGTAYINCISGEVTGTAVITVEGFIATITVESDTYVDEADPSSSFGTETTLKAGYVDATAKHLEAYLKFPFGSIPGSASIESVVMKLYPTSAGDSTLQIKQLEGAFTDTTTWGARPSMGAYVMGGVFSADGSYNELSGNEFTSLVSKWLTGEVTNNGLAIVQEGTENGTVVILSLENGTNFPILEIEYTD